MWKNPNNLYPSFENLKANEQEIIFLQVVRDIFQQQTECSDLEALDFAVTLLDKLELSNIKIN